MIVITSATHYILLLHNTVVIRCTSRYILLSNLCDSPQQMKVLVGNSSTVSIIGCVLCPIMFVTANNVIYHMSLTCCIKSHCTPATLAPAHTPCLFSIDLHTVRQHLVIVHFLLLPLLSGTLFQMMSSVPHHCHHLSLV